MHIYLISLGFTGKLLFSLDHGFNTIVHVLNKVFLRSAEPSLVGDVKDSIIGFSVLSVNSSDLNVVLVCNFLELWLILGEAWKLDVN